MNKKKILYICGSMNQTTQMHKISLELSEHEAYFTPFFDTGFLEFLNRLKLVEFTILGETFKQNTLKYLKENNLKIDYRGKNDNYDLVITSQDITVPSNIKKFKTILVQEGMSDPLPYTAKRRDAPKRSSTSCSRGSLPGAGAAARPALMAISVSASSRSHTVPSIPKAFLWASFRQRVCLYYGRVSHRPSRTLRQILPFVPVLLGAACANVINLSDPQGPRFEGRYAPVVIPAVASAAPGVRVVTFNLKLVGVSDQPTQASSCGCSPASGCGSSCDSC